MADTVILFPNGCIAIQNIEKTCYNVVLRLFWCYLINLCDRVGRKDLACNVSDIYRILVLGP